MKNPVRIACIGHTTLDDIILSDPGISYFRQPGGGALHSAAGAALWNRANEVGVVTRLPKSFPETELEKIRALGSVDGEGFVRTEQRGILLWLLYDADNYRHWVKHHDSSTREEAAPVAAEIPTKYLRECRGFHIAPLPLPNVEELLTALPENAIIQIDPHYEWFFQKYTQRWLPVLRRTDILMPSEDEFAKFFDIPYGQKIEAYLPYVKRLTQMGPKLVIVKMGAQGALVADAASREIYLVPSVAEPDRIIDFTGAGDGFCGSFLYHYAAGGELIDCAIRGMVGASLAMEHRGVTNSFQIQEGVAQKRYEEVKQRVLGEITRLGW